MTNDDSTRIAIRGAKTWTIKDWKEIDFSLDPGWQKAIDIFEDRICGRFLDVIDMFCCKNGAGFAVLALDCLLIETLQQFREGKAETPRGKSGEYFRLFLTETSFKKHFIDDLPNLFYDQIRCGILHQAEVKKSSRVKTNDEIPLIAKDENGGIVINRKKFHKQLEFVFAEYVNALRNNDPSDPLLRENFRKKMNAICRIEEKKEEKTSIGILAFGSLITDPGWEILDLTDHCIQSVTTPFPVEYARRSKTRANAPTLVPVPDGKGIPVQAAVFVLKENVSLQQANNILYRREVHRVGDSRKIYTEPEVNELNKMRIAQISVFANLDIVIYTNLAANFEEILDDRYNEQQKSEFLCNAAIDSLSQETFRSCQDGIHYLDSAIHSGVVTHLTELYAQAIKNTAGDNVVDLYSARTIIAKSKGL